MEIKYLLGSPEISFFNQLVVALSQHKKVGYSLHGASFSTRTSPVLCSHRNVNAFWHSGFVEVNVQVRFVVLYKNDFVCHNVVPSILKLYIQMVVDSVDGHPG